MEDQDQQPREPGEERQRSRIHLFFDYIPIRIGLFYGLLSGVALAIQLISAKALLQLSLMTDQILFFRSAGMVVMLVSVHWTESNSYDGYDLVIYCFYGLTNVIGLYLSYVALQFTSMGNVNAVAMNLSVPTAILSFFALGETITRCGIGLFLINCIGIVLISIPSQNNFTSVSVEGIQHFIGVLFAFGSLVFMASSRIIARKSSLRETMDSSLMTVMSGMVGMPLCLFIHMTGTQWHMLSSYSTWIWLVVYILSSIGTNQFAMIGLKYEPANNVSILNSISVPISFTVGLLVFRQVPGILHVVGALLIIGSTAGSYVGMWNLRLPDG